MLAIWSLGYMASRSFVGNAQDVDPWFASTTDFGEIKFTQRILPPARHEHHDVSCSFHEIQETPYQCCQVDHDWFSLATRAAIYHVKHHLSRPLGVQQALPLLIRL